MSVVSTALIERPLAAEMTHLTMTAFFLWLKGTYVAAFTFAPFRLLC